MTKISILTPQNEIPSLGKSLVMGQCRAITAAELVRAAHMIGTEKNENRGKSKLESRQV